jgi:hypothetical protein
MFSKKKKNPTKQHVVVKISKGFHIIAISQERGFMNPMKPTPVNPLMYYINFLLILSSLKKNILSL